VDEPDDVPGYVMELVRGNWAEREPARLSTALLWTALVEDLRGGVNKARIAARFHAGVAAGFVRVAALAREATGVNKVVMSGGCMHNRRLSRLLRTKLRGEEFEVYQHMQVSPGDGGLSYGQAVVGAALSKLAGEAD
jgi:hydrogenase maturation protein HypF